MPGDTKIKRTAQGWIDIDQPTVFHPNRRTARDARRGRPSTAAIRAQAIKPSTAKPSQRVSDGSTPFTSLQARLYTRLTMRQSVSDAEAQEILAVNPYNKAASYGHMRAAGANHAEAVIVINLGNPDVSLAYGQARAAGYNHTYALQKALREAQDDDADD